MRGIFIDAPMANQFWPAPGCPEPASLLQQKIDQPSGLEPFTYSATLAPPPTPKSHSP